ncbi:MAG: carboxypeptidase regulatory-like domain-containing protein [Acidobacteria bacterium]|nr:carboxypeptidase regulatory-like domain-containing protein [Acidobacteriota bacterium]
MPIAATLFLALATLLQAQPQEPSSLQGAIHNSATNQPVHKAYLLLLPAQAPEDLRRSLITTSDSAGNFSMANIPPGKYRLRVIRKGFLTADHPTIFDFSTPQQRKDIDIRLTPHGVIAGRILDAEGEPLDHVQLQLLQLRYRNGRKIPATIRSAYSNDLGEFRWPDLAPGKYYVFASHIEGIPLPISNTVDYVPIYYPNSPDFNAALPIEITPGAQLRLADMAFPRSLTATVKGRVVVEIPGARSKPIVRFYRQPGHDNSGAISSRFQSATLNPAGEFVIRNLTPGPYIASAEVEKGGLSFAGSTNVTITGNFDDLIITVPNPVTITGRVRSEGNAPADLTNIRVQLQRNLADSDAYPLKPSGTFQLDHLTPARYIIRASNLPEGFYTKRVLAESTDITTTGIDLKASAPSAIDILISPKAAKIYGVVLHPDSRQPTPGATIAIVPKDKQLRHLTEHTIADPEGRFRFPNLTPGDYQLYAWKEVEPGAWFDPEFLAPFEEKAISVTIAEGAQSTQQLTAIAPAAQTK